MSTIRHWCIALLILVLPPALAWGQTRYYVNGATGNTAYDGLSATVGTFPSGPKATVQEAVNAAASTDTIVLAAGTYNENVLINAKNITFNSSGTATVDSVSYTGGARPGVKSSYVYTTVGVNGPFTSATNWSFGTGWSHNSGAGRAERASSSTVSALQSAVFVTAGRVYRLTYTYNRTSLQGGILPMVGGTMGTQQSSNGTFTEEIRAGTVTGVTFYPVNGAIFNMTGNLDNVVLESKTETIAAVRVNKLYVESGNGDDIQQAVNLLTTTTGRVWTGAGTYAFTTPVYVTKACKIYGQDTLTGANSAQRRILASAAPTTYFYVTTSAVTIKGFQMQVRSTGVTSVSIGTNTETAGIVVAGASTGVQINNCHFQNNNSTIIPNGVGIRAWDQDHAITARNCFFTSKDTTNLTSGFFSRGFWSENGRLNIDNNWFLYGGLQDMLIRFTRNIVNIRYNRIRGYGLEVNTLGSNIVVSGNVFTQPSGQPAVAYGGLIGKGNSGANTYTVSNNRFENYSTPALQAYGQSNMTITGNTFSPPATGDFTHLQISTCSNPDNCTAGNNVSSVVIKSNLFQNGAAGQGTAIKGIRHASTNVITSTQTVGASGEENTFQSDLKNWILWDTTSGRPVTSILNAAENYYAVTSGTIKPSAFTAQDHLDAEAKITHYLDCASAGVITLKANTYAITNTGNCRYPQRGITQLTNGGMLILSSASPTYPATSVTGKGITLQSHPLKARMTQLTLDAGGFTLGLTNSLSLTTNLTLTNGLIASTTADTLFLTPTTPTALTYTAGRITTNFNRGIVAGQQYLYPIGFDTAGRETYLSCSSVSGGLSSITARCRALNPNTSPVASTFTNYVDGQVIYAMLPANEYVTVTPNQGSATWSASVKYPTLSGFDGFLLAKRPTGGNVWAVVGSDNFPAPQGTNQFLTGELKRDNMVGFSDLTIAGGLEDPLPVKLDEFTLTRKDGAAWARWHVLEESNVSGYVLTIKGLGDEAMTMHVPANERATPKYYQSFLANLPPGRTITVVLHSHEADGRLLYVGTRVLAGTGVVDETIAIYPNPMHGQFQVSGRTFERFHLIDQTGKKVWHGNLTENCARLGALPPGLYTLELYSPSNSGSPHRSRVVLQ